MIWKQPEAVFLDRDGTIGGGKDTEYPSNFKLFPNVQESLFLLKERGIKIFAFTNQPGIARGEEVRVSFDQELLSFGFDDVYLCPHSHLDGCACRKPSPALLRKAAQDYQLNLNNCVVIGDRWSDMVAGYQAGCKKILVLTGAGKDALSKYRDKWDYFEPEHIALDVVKAVKWVLSPNN